MKSSEGLHFVGLDHVRALAVFLVFTYHFLMATHGGVHSGALSFPVDALLTEGHTGVALFMTLSGYLFMRLTRDRQIDYPSFLYNRALRLAPLLVIVLLIQLVVFRGSRSLLDGLSDLVSGLVFPVWPNGGWSVTTELHFYLLFPVMLLLAKRDDRFLLVVPLLAVAFRTVIYFAYGGQQVQDLAYWTIVGRIDQFALGMIAATCADLMAGKTKIAVAIIVGWILAWYGFAVAGGFDAAGHKWIWIGLTTVEGAVYATLIAWYDRSFTMRDTGVSRLIGQVGTWSFSIYLWHFFFVHGWARWVDLHIVSLENFYVSVAFAIPAFAGTAAIARASYLYLEMPFLRYRTSYFRDAAQRGASSLSSGPSGAPTAFSNRG